MFWIVPAFYTAFGVIFFALARVMPPPRADVTTDQMVHFFHAHALTIKIGFGVLVLIVGGAGISNGIVVYHMKRMTVGSVMAYAYLGAMSVGALPGCLLVAFCFLTAVYRPGRDPQLLALLYDLGLLSYVGSLGCFSTAYFAFAVAILYDKNEIFPQMACLREHLADCHRSLDGRRCSCPRRDRLHGTAPTRSGWAR